MNGDVFTTIQKAAWQAGVSVTKLCRAAGVEPSTVYRWKTGRHSALKSTVDRLLAKAAELQKQNKHLADA